MELAVIIIFITCSAIVLYAYVGYGILLHFLLKRKKVDIPDLEDQDLPTVTHVIAAYNEEACIEEKIGNCLSIDYPEEKVQTIIITDGSVDHTPALVRVNPRVKLMHQPQRQGKLAAMHRAISEANGDITIFSDANAMLNGASIRKMVRHFQNNLVGAVAGEKQVISRDDENASSGEGLYWKYESYLKSLDYKLHTVVGAAGELFALRTHLFKIPEEPAIIEDFVLTVSMAGEGYRVAYEPEAVAKETGSANLMEELKRKVRISAGGIQASWRLRHLLNPFKYGVLSFQLFSHRTIRWTLAPISLFMIFVTSAVLSTTGSVFFQLALWSQMILYLYAILGYYLDESGRKIKYGLSLFYFAFMNYSVFLGLIFLLKKREMLLWEKAKRA